MLRHYSPHSFRSVSACSARNIPEAMLEAASLFRQHARLNCWVPSQGTLAPHAKSGGTAEGSPFSCYRAEIRTGRQVAVDFETDTNLFKCRSSPDHPRIPKLDYRS